MLSYKNKRSFQAVAWRKYSGDIEKAVSQYIDDNWQVLDLQSHRVKNPDEANLAHLSLHRIIAYDTPGDIIEFDAVVIADLEIYETSHSQAIDGEAEQWFRVSCTAKLDDGFNDFRITGIDIYDSHEKDPRGKLTDSLVPVISKSQLEKTAEDILRQYYPEALSAPIPVNVRRFAERVGLTVQEAHLSKSCTVFGMMIFNDCTIEYYDIDAQRFETAEVERRTILVDPEVYFLRTLGSWNNSIVHEGVHWIKHRKALELERLYNADVRMIRCQVSGKEHTDEEKRSDTDWMEWHANALAPRILMPRKPYKDKAEELIAWYGHDLRTDNIADVLPGVIAELADYFGVSKQAAKIRMIDVGYTEAVGVFEYVDNRYVPHHSFGDSIIGSKQTFSVPVVDSVIQYAVNPDFQRIMDSGNFVYIDTHYCINDPKYVVANEYGILEMTEYAVKHMDECCLTFDRTTRSNANYGVQRYTECVLFKDAVSQTVNEFEYSHTDHNKAVEARAAAILAEQREVKDAAAILAKLPAAFHTSLVVLMDWRGITVEQLAEKSLVEPKTIQRMRNTPDYNCKLETLIALCIGLQLPPYISTPLLGKAGHTIRLGEQGITYAHLLTNSYKSSIHEVNEHLEIAGFPRLSGKE